MQHDYAINNTAAKESTLDKARTLDRFLAQVERKAFRIAELAVSNREEALDIVQDSMIGLVQKYSDRPEEEWMPLFYRILQSRIRDWYRKNKVRSKWMSWLGFSNKDNEGEQDDAMASVPDPAGRDPQQTASNHESMEQLDEAIHNLPYRQQQAFLLRTWEGLSVAETASAMKCSQGSVKTHYSRALHALRLELEDYRHE